eukprot:jgi/Tetstr1/437897/TSEL_026528.t2
MARPAARSGLSSAALSPSPLPALLSRRRAGVRLVHLKARRRWEDCGSRALAGWRTPRRWRGLLVGQAVKRGEGQENTVPPAAPPRPRRAADDDGADERALMAAGRNGVQAECELDEGDVDDGGYGEGAEEVSPSQLSVLITEASSVYEVEGLVAAQAPAFGVSAIIATLVKLLKLQCGKGPGGGSLDGSAAVAQLGDIAGSVCEAATPLQLGVMGRAFALLGHADLALWDALTAQVRGCSLSQFTPSALADLLWAYGHIRYVPDRNLLDAISAELAGAGRMADHRQVLLEVSARSSLGGSWTAGGTGMESGDEEREEAGVSELRDPSVSPLDSFSSRELCTILCAYGKMEYPPGRVVEGVVAQLLREGRRGEMTGQELAMLLWGCAKLGVRPMALLDAVASELAGRLAAGGEVALLHGVGREWATYAMRRPQQLDDCDRVLASCVWAYGKLNHHPGSLLAAAADAAAPRVPLMAPKELARMVWGFAKLGSAPPRFLAALGEQLGDPARLRLFRPIQVSIIMWSLSLLEYELTARVLQHVADYAAANAAGFSAQGLANTAWAFVRIGDPPPGLLSALLAEAAGRLGEFEPQGVSELVKAAAAAVEEVPPGFLEGVSAHVVDNIEDFALEDVLDILISFHELRFQADSMLEAVEQWADRRMGRLSPQGLSMTLWSFAFTGHANATLLSTAAGACAAMAEEFSPQQLARVLWSFAKLDFRPEGDLLDELAAQCVAKVRLFAQKELANILWAYGRLEHRPDGLLEAAGEWAAPRLSSFSPQAIANINWAYARLQHRDEALLHALAAQSVAVAHQFTPQGISMTVYAFALQRFSHDVLLTSLAEEVVHRDLADFEPQNFANIIWGFAKLGHDPAPALDCLAREVAERLPSFSGQELFNIVWAFARLRRPPPAPLLEVTAAEMSRRVGELNCQELANTAWAYARLDAHQPRLFDALYAAAADRLPAFDLQHLVNLLWALAVTGHDAQGMLPKLLRELDHRVEGMRPQHLAMVMRSLALLRVSPGAAFLGRIQARAHAQADRFRRFEICGLLWGFATLGVQPGRLLKLLAPRGPWDAAMRRRDMLRPSEMVRGLWALVAMRQYQLPATQWLARCLAVERWMGPRGEPYPEVQAMRDQAFELLDRLSPAVTEGLPDWREGSARGAPEPLASLAEEVAGALASLSPDAEALVCRTAQGWLLPGPRGATLLQPVDEAALVWQCHQGGGGGNTWQFSGEAACRQRLLRHASMRHMTHTALLLDGDWAEAGGADDAREACLVAALERAVPFGRAAGDGGGGAAVVPCQTAKLMWRTDGLLEL